MRRTSNDALPRWLVGPLRLTRDQVDQYQLIADILWSGFAVSIIALIAGVLLSLRGQRGAALALLFIAVIGTLAFSLVGGLSIGRFTVLFPVLISGYVVAIGRGRVTVAIWVLGAAVLYIAFSWLLTPVVLAGGVFALVFGLWAIPAYAILALAAFGWSALNPPSGGSATTR